LTLPPLLELLDRSGRYADHLMPTDPRGLPGWHYAHGPWMPWGDVESGSEAMQQMGVGPPLLPVLGPIITPELDQLGPNCIPALRAVAVAFDPLLAKGVTPEPTQVSGSWQCDVTNSRGAGTPQVNHSTW